MIQSGGFYPPLLHSIVDTIMFTVRFKVPYNSCEWREQTFRTLEEAQRMVDFYRSCGSPAHLI